MGTISKKNTNQTEKKHTMKSTTLTKLLRLKLLLVLFDCKDYDYKMKEMLGFVFGFGGI